MSWLFFAVLSSAVYAVTNFVDKYILEREVKDYRGLTVYTTLASFTFGILYWTFTGFPILGAQDAILVMGTGMLTIWGLSLYFRALSIEETSTVIILMQLVPVITLLMSSIFLGERISAAQVIGFILILAAVTGVSVKKTHLKMKFSKALLYILLADICWAAANVLFKFVVSTTTFSQLVPYESLGIAAGGVILYLLFPTVRDTYRITKNSLSKIGFSFIFINELIFVTAKILGYYAISLGPVSLVGIVSSTQVFFGIYYGWILTLLNRELFKEDISASGIIKRIFLAIVVFGGIWLMQY